MNRIGTYTKRAESEFRNLMPYSARGAKMRYADGGVAGGAAYGTLDSNNRTLTFVVKNTNTDSDLTARLFAAAIDPTDAALPAGITINVEESSHLQVKQELLASPFRIVGLRYKVSSSANQFDNKFVIAESDMTGMTVSKTVQPSTWRSAQNQQDKQVDALTFEMIVSKNAYIDVKINAGETATMIFYIAEKLNEKNVLAGRPSLEVARTLPPTGLPQLDMISR